jgi:hypothetical protein
MTQRHKELLERHKTGQKQGNIDFHQKKNVGSKGWWWSGINSKLAKPIDYSNNK